jgi:hypothetical protein
LGHVLNDDPNIDAGMEDAMHGDELYRKLLGRLLQQFATPHAAHLASGQTSHQLRLHPPSLKRDRIDPSRAALSKADAGV